MAMWPEEPEKCLEDHTLYQALVVLHKTRNKLAHSGDVDSPEHLTLDHQGAKAALLTALGAYRWYAARGRFVTMYGAWLNPE